MFKFNLGDLVKDRITGFSGVIVSRTEWLNGCIRYMCQSQKLKDGKPGEYETFDEQQIDLVTAAKIKVDTPEVRTGGPRRDATSPVRQEPRR